MQAQGLLDQAYQRAAAANEAMAAAEQAYSMAAEYGSVHQQAVASLPQEIFAR